MRKHVLLAAVLTSAIVASAVIPAAQAESLKVALPQKGNWDTGIVEFGMKAGIFKEAGIDIEPVYTQGGSATVQAVISGSVVSTAMTGSPDLYWYARSDKGIKSLKDTDGKSVAYSAAGSSSHLIVLSLLEQAKSKAKPTATGGIPGTYTQVMSGQIDVGWAVPPFGLEDVKSGKVVIVAKGNDVPAIRNETIRVNFANADTLTKKRALLVKFSEAYAKALDWSYRDPKAIAYFAEGAEVTPEIALQARDQFYPKESLQPYEVKGLDLALQQALEYKFIPRAMTEKEVAGLFDILAPKPK
jgi:NitT/TauT family transport system substrate-binding protein